MAKQTAADLRAKAADLIAKADALDAAEKAANTLANLSAGDVIEYMYGRGENRKQYAGVVNGVAETDKGKRVKVTTGEGFDAEIHVIDPSAIVGPVDRDEAQGEALEAGQAAADPLSAIQ